MSSLVGPSGVLWRAHRAFALVVASTCPSGDPIIVELRDRLRYAAFHVHGSEPFASAPSRLFHQSSPFGGAPPSHIYVGIGTCDTQGRPAPWANPFYFIDPGATDLLERYE